jgi:hypothetical protein
MSNNPLIAEDTAESLARCQAVLSCLTEATFDNPQSRRSVYGQCLMYKSITNALEHVQNVV